jgi:hypothetical protein
LQADQNHLRELNGWHADAPGREYDSVPPTRPVAFGVAAAVAAATSIIILPNFFFLILNLKQLN